MIYNGIFLEAMVAVSYVVQGVLINCREGKTGSVGWVNVSCYMGVCSPPIFLECETVELCLCVCVCERESVFVFNIS